MRKSKSRASSKASSLANPLALKIFAKPPSTMAISPSHPAPLTSPTKRKVLPTTRWNATTVKWWARRNARMESSFQRNSLTFLTRVRPRSIARKSRRTTSQILATGTGNARINSRMSCIVRANAIRKSQKLGNNSAIFRKGSFARECSVLGSCENSLDRAHQS